MTSITAARPDRPQLGLVLRLWLAFVALAGLWTAYRTWTTIEDLVDHHDPLWSGDMVWALPALLGLSLGNALCAALIFLRLKLGVWLILLDAAASLLIVLVVRVPLAALLPGLGGLAVLLFLVRTNWRAMR